MTNTTTARRRRDVVIRLQERNITPMASERMSQRVFFGLSALLFAASATATIVWCHAMSVTFTGTGIGMGIGMGMGEMPMPLCGAMSMTWLRLPGQTWFGAAASFLGMWVVMMVAMMLPSLMPMLWRYRQAVDRTGASRLGPLTALVGTGYFFVWTLAGLAVYPLGVTLAAVERHLPWLAPAVPFAAGAVVLFAGAIQFTAWKAHHLARCRNGSWRGQALPADAGTAWRHGMRLGLDCFRCCAGLTAVLLVAGVMDLRAMAAIMVAITTERLAPLGSRVAQVIGATAAVAGLLMIVRAAGLA